MKKDMIFFSTDGKGLTSTSANHIANLAKEMVRGIESSLDSMLLYTTSVALIGSDSEKTLTVGSTREDLDAIPHKLRTIAKANSLIAWLREAIKARERLLKEVDDYTLKQYCEDNAIEMPQPPTMSKALTDDDYYASLTVAERNRYYELETLASVIGEAIHPGGSFARAREALTSRINAPNEVNGSGRDTLIYTYTPTVEPENVEDIYFSLQKLHRETQASLNAIKYDCQKAVSASELAAKTEYVDATKAYTEKIELLRAKLSKYKSLRSREIGDYKIVIPESLGGIYDEVSHLGKK
ncbi:MAG: hypothetical protein Q4C34_09830 [Bacteroidales bacterium]|nr:hypothetical protein [Bacteroidales bacterium]